MSKSKKTITEYRYYELPLHFPVLLLSGEKWKVPDVKTERLHFHNCLELGICHTESGLLELEDKVYSFEAGDVTVIPRNISHATYSSKGKRSLWTFIFIDTDVLFSRITQDSQLISELALLNNSGFQHILPQKDFPKIYALTSAIADELKVKPYQYENSVTALLFSLCIEIGRVQTQFQKQKIDTMPRLNSGNQALVSNKLAIVPALQYIENNYMESITISQLAEICNLSETHFRRSFRKIIGKSPLDYINGIRINKSCTLLMSTDESIAYISICVGFGSISSFNRCFSKIMGISPREWRKLDNISKGKVDRGSVIKYEGWL